MYNRIRTQILKFLRVPHDPEPPIGAPGSARTFRAGRNYYYVRLLRWGVAQIGAAIGILFSVGFLMQFTSDVEEHHARAARQAATAAAVSAPATPEAPPRNLAGTEPSAELVPGQTEPSAPPAEAKKKRQRRANGYTAFVSRTPPWLARWLGLLELGGIALFIVQIPITFIAARLEYELRWYIVTDRSLRIRAGIVSLQESTMSFANLQQVEVRQGPLQRLLGIADVRVQSAGGGGSGHHKGAETEDSLHTGIFHGVDNANEIRDLILERLKAFREAGLGDPDDERASASAPAGPGNAGTETRVDDAAAAARELLSEARALRQVVS